MLGVGFALIVMPCEALPEHPDDVVWITLTVPAPDEPHVTVILFVPAPDVIVPPVTVQA